jgi:hypothetical protein
MTRCRIAGCKQPRWPTFDGVCFDHGMFPETITARPLTPLSARRVKRLAFACHDVAKGRRSKVRVGRKGEIAAHELADELRYTFGAVPGLFAPYRQEIALELASFLMGAADSQTWPASPKGGAKP